MFLLETGNIKPFNAGFRSHLQSGSFVIFTVNKQINSNLYQILLHGKFMNVRSSRILQEGSRINAQVSWVKNRLRLNVFNKSDPLSDLLNKSSLVSNNDSRMVAEGLIRSYMPFDPSYFEKIESVLRKKRDINNKIVKVLLLLIDKDIPISEKNISEILSYNDRREDGHFEGDKKNVKTRKIKNNNIDEIKADIKNQIKRSDTGKELLKYFNHRIASHDNWLIIPLNYSFTRPGLGVLKLRLDKRFTITNLVLSLDDGMEWEFSLNKTRNSAGMKVWGPSEISWENTDAFIKLKQKLYNIGIIIDDINKEVSRTDGFSELSSGKYDSINFVV